MKNASSLRDHAVRTLQFGDVSITELRITSRAVAARSASALDRGPLQELLFVLGGELRLLSRGQVLRLHAHEWIACDAGDIALLHTTANAHALLVTMPASGDLCTTVHSGLSGVDSVLFSFISSVMNVGDELTPQTRADLGNAVIELAAVALRAKSAPTRRMPGPKIMRDRVETFVRHHLRRSSLSIDELARAFNCTKRYLHKVFSEGDRSLNRFIWDLRLERCSRDLTSPDLLDRSITEVALSWGFRSTPHFSRMFRKRFGVSPSAYRLANLPKPVSPAALRASERFPWVAHDSRAERRTHAL